MLFLLLYYITECNLFKSDAHPVTLGQEHNICHLNHFMTWRTPPHIGIVAKACPPTFPLCPLPVLGTSSIFIWIIEVVYFRADYRFAPSQWETALLCNDVSYWLGTNLESAWCRSFVLLSSRYNSLFRTVKGGHPQPHVMCFMSAIVNG